jgi:3-dehydroquinate dehydratase II
MADRNESAVLVIHGPNLNMLGRREPGIYGETTLEEINARLVETGKAMGLWVETFQSNHEGEIVEKIQGAGEKFQGLIINPAAYTHTSVAIRDAAAMLDIPFIETHLTNIHAREAFRQKSFLADIAAGHIAGLGAYGYVAALTALWENHLKK